MNDTSTSQTLSFFGWVFFIIGAIIMLIALIKCFITYDLDYEELTFWVYVIGALFTASWGALLFGIRGIANK